MHFRPKINEEIRICRNHYRFTEHPSAPGMPYGQTGRRATVYQLQDDHGDFHALKVFTQAFRSPQVELQATQIGCYADLPGLAACQRSVLTPGANPEQITANPDLSYAVLMPWMQGITWQEIVMHRQPISRGQSLLVAENLVSLLAVMEQNNLAHCDLSGSNVIVNLDAQHVTGNGDSSLALIDLEDLYAPGLTLPEKLPAGSIGYAHRSSGDGVWSPEADRFAGAVLLAEILGWCDELVRAAACGEQYYDPDELQENSDRYQLLCSVLTTRWGDQIVAAFKRIWFCSNLSDCLPMAEWAQLLQVDVPEIKIPAQVLNSPHEPELAKLDQKQLGSLVSHLSAAYKIAPTFVEDVYQQAVNHQRIIKTPPYYEPSQEKVKVIDLENKVRKKSQYICIDREVRNKQNSQEPDIYSINLYNDVFLEFVHVPAGPFLMGSSSQDSDAEEDEKPIHEVWLDDYWIGRTPITKKQFGLFVVERVLFRGRFAYDPTLAEHPVTKITWKNAKQYCDWASEVSGLSIGLPTEAQWEKAARGTERRIFPWGNQAPNHSLANFDGILNGTCPVGTFKQANDLSIYGALDLAGNVYEWIADRYGENYYQVSPKTNPENSEVSDFRVLRGGSWSGDFSTLRAARRDSQWPNERNDDIGFRCVLKG